MFSRTLRLQGTFILILAVSLVSLVHAQETTPEATPQPDPQTVVERGVGLFPLEVVTEDPPTLQDLSPTSARVNFVGTIPLGCILVFGETRDFGRATQDPGMSSATIVVHNPVMTGLEPETEYFYRLQGSDEAGNFYTSPVYSFTTPAESDEVSDNLLSPERGAEVIDVSSNFGGQPIEGSTWGAANAFDDDPNTAWSSDGDGDDAYVTVRLGQRSQINEIEFWTRTMSNDTAQIFSFQIVTEDGDVFGPFELPDPNQPYTFETDIIAEQLRFEVVESNGGNTGAVSIAAYGDPLDE